jgi:hypothetical protein
MQLMSVSLRLRAFARDIKVPLFVRVDFGILQKLPFDSGSSCLLLSH